MSALGDSDVNQTIIADATHVMWLICGDRFSSSCDRVVAVGSQASNLFLSICCSIIGFLSRTALMLISLVLRLVCRGELRTTCDTVAAFGVRACEIIAYFSKQILAFIRDTALPVTLHAMDVAKEFTSIHVAPFISQGFDVLRETLGESVSSASEKTLLLKQQSADWLADHWVDGFRDIPDMSILTTNISKSIGVSKLNFITISNETLRRVGNAHSDLENRILLPIAIAIAILVMRLKFWRTEQSRSKQMFKRESLETQSGFLHWDDDLEDEDQTIFTTIRSPPSSIEQELPAASFGTNKVMDHRDASRRLPAVKGPSATTLTFRAYAPPTIDKEIPKVDVMGTLQFVKTGQVRTFVHRGSKRLLVLNLQDMTLEIHFPKSNDNYPKVKQSPKKLSTNMHSGIHLMSNRNLMSTLEDESDVEQDDEMAWDRKCFEATPAHIIKLSDFVSVSAMPSHQSSVFEIWYKTSKSKKAAYSSKNFDNNTVKATNFDDSSLDESSGLLEETASMNGSYSNHLESDHTKTKIVIERRKEFTFTSPHDGAEFQRIIMAMRVAGKEISQLYEMLEELHVRSDDYYPQKLSPKQHYTKSAKDAVGKNHVNAPPQFSPAGVALDDAWRSMNGISHLREGLLQYHQYSHQKSSSKYNDLIVTAAGDEEVCTDEESNYRKEMAQFYSTNRSVIGLVDFMYLFIHPNQSQYRASDVNFNNALLLQKLVDRTSMYIIAYCRAKEVFIDGWKLLPRPKSFDDEGDDSEQSGEHAHVNLKRLAFDNDKENWAHDLLHRNEYYEASVGKDVCVVIDGNSSDFQGYALVQIHTFRLNPEDDWLDPETNPINSLPSLRGIIEKYMDRQFLVVLYFNKYSGIAACHLYVRSLPVGIDTGFDNAMADFISGSPQVRNERLQVAFQFGFDESLSSLKRILVRATLGIIFRWFFGKRVVLLNKGLRERLACPPVLARHFAAIRYFPQSQRSPYPQELKNFIGITVEDRSNWMSWLLRRVSSNRKHDSRNQGLLYDCSLVIKDERCSRALLSARFVHLNPQAVAMPHSFKERHDDSELFEAVNLSTVSTSMAATVWSKRRKSSDELYSFDIDTVFDALDGVRVARRTLSSDGEILVVDELARLYISRADIERYLIASSCDIRATSVKIIESCAWRGHVFPVDRKQCRIELCSGQCFQQGHDVDNNPIFYFRHFLRGPYTGSAEGSILAVLHRLETFFQRMSILNPGVKVTAIILMGGSGTIEQDAISPKQKSVDHDPMIDPNQDYTAHGSVESFIRLISILRQHYPERLGKALIVPGPSGKWSKSRVREYITTHQLFTPRVKLLNNLFELRKYVKTDQLVTFAGGTASVTPDAFTIH